jgi:4-alpha-glucanotransferase
MTPLTQRASGILLHITSLPSKTGIGDLGTAAYRFVDQLAACNQGYWSILPLNPTSQPLGNSPYMSDSAFAGNTLLISPQLLAENGLLPKEANPPRQTAPENKVNFSQVEATKKPLLNKAFENFKANQTGAQTDDYDFDRFHADMAYWLEDYAVYKALRQKSGKPWLMWPEALRDREPLALTAKRQNLRKLIEKEEVLQFLFFSQWRALKAYCTRNGVRIVGDMPFYVGLDSADVWTHPELFKLGKDKKPLYVAGVPPDYFSKTGQLWGTPVYQWRELAKTQFDWWIKRISHNLALCDLLRFDHFRGFVAYWHVSAGAKTAQGGRWIRAPTHRFFHTVKAHFPAFPFIAEDLGAITDPVRKTITRFGLPGMRVLLFAFDGADDNPHLPQNHIPNSVVYTGTHDTNTVKGWFTDEASAETKQKISQYLGREVTPQNVSEEFVKMALSSKANLAIIPLQDILGLDSEARMNHPAASKNNWQWRVTPQQLANPRLGRFGELIADAERAPMG